MIRFRHAAASAVAFPCALLAALSSSPGLALETTVPAVVDLATGANNEMAADPVPAIRFAVPQPVIQPLHADVQPAVDPEAAAQIDADDHDTLTEAVAAQIMPAEMADDLECLATAVYFESKGEPLSGQLAVANVVLNRSRSGRFPASVCGVVTQRGQFGFVRGGRLPDVDTDRRDWKTAVAVAKVAMADAWDTPAPGALYFHARRAAPGWNRAHVVSIGNHIFYR